MMLSGDGGVGRKKWVMLQAPGVNTATIGVLLMLSVYLGLSLTFRWAGEAPLESIYAWGSLSWEGLSRGQVWRLFTHIWLHGNVTHLAVNAALFYYAAARLSHVLSNWRIFALFLVCGVGAGLAHVISQAFFPEIPAMIGASGGVTGLLLGFFSISPDSRMLLLNISARNLSKGVLISSALLFAMSPWLNLPLLADLGHWLGAAIGDFVFRAAHLVHFAGGLLGWTLIARFFPKLLTSNDLSRMRLERETNGAIR